MTVYEIAYVCGCKFAVHKKSVTVRICKKHYDKLKGVPIEALLVAHLKIHPELIVKLQKEKVEELLRENEG